MCTSLTMKTRDSKHLMARTMDFAFELGATVSYMPRNHTWATTLETQATYTTEFAFIGAGKKLGEPFYFVDGVNEKGLAVAELYFPREAKYYKETKEGFINLTPHEIPKWILGNYDSIEGLLKDIDRLRIVDQPIALINVTPPLHYILQDTTGRCVVLESDSGEIVVKENPLGVMTNSPNLEWHLMNLNNYIGLTNLPLDAKEMNGVKFETFGQGSGSFGMPGGYTPPERFVRTLFLKQSSTVPVDSTEAVNTLLHILHAVDIPKGAVIQETGALDYTQYISVMSLEDKAYLMKLYDNPTIYKVELDELLLKNTEPFEFKISNDFEFQLLQAK